MKILANKCYHKAVEEDGNQRNPEVRTVERNVESKFQTKKINDASHDRHKWSLAEALRHKSCQSSYLRLFL